MIKGMLFAFFSSVLMGGAAIVMSKKKELKN